MEEEDRKDGLERLTQGLTVNTDVPTAATIKKEADSTLSSPNDSKHSQSHSSTPTDRKARSDSASTPDGPQRPKLSRKPSSKIPVRAAPLFDHLPDVTDESCAHFQLITDCLYGSKSLGATDHDALDCDCNEQWQDGINHACGEDSDCINRATKVECVDKDCNCGDSCQNQRFQRRQYADVSVIKTEKKGYGLRANKRLHAHEFIFEYIGEVVNEPTFRRRFVQYDKEGIKHFYFMSLTKHEFVDATKKGNLGRFCNHSCNPNSYVDKWVVGNKLRMGIFASREIQPGEELVFNYNVDRYGSDPMPCYCGEPNCIGFIGGKTQTERATKLPDATIEALGIDDGGDNWDTAVAKKPRKKKVNEDDEDYVNSVQARSLDVKGVTKVMATLMQCKEKWIAIKLLERIQRCDDDRVRNRVVQMHGYQILKTVLNTFIEDNNVILQILDILYQFPRLTKNKIVDSKIESAVQRLISSEHEDVAAESARLLDEWSKLEVAYRIPRKKLDPNAQAGNPYLPNLNAGYDERRGARLEEAKKPDTALPTNIPKGPRSSVPQRNPNFHHTFPRRNRPAPAPAALPQGWFSAANDHGNLYYYNKSGVTTWTRPTEPAPDASSAQFNGPSKAQQAQKTLQEIIDAASKPGGMPGNAPGRSASQTPQPTSTPAQEIKREKWRSLPIDKQKRIYENTLSPVVLHVMNKFKNKLPRDELKRFAKEISKKLVSSDYKNGRVDDPTSISEHKEKKVKQHVYEFFNKAVQKYLEHEKKKADHGAKVASESSQPQSTTNGHDPHTGDTSSAVMDNEDIVMSDDEDLETSPGSSELKRKHEDGAADSPSLTPSETPSFKRLKEDENENGAPSPPPPPPPPPETEVICEPGQVSHDLVQQAQQEEEQRQKFLAAQAALEEENALNLLEDQKSELKREVPSVMSH
ncbi:hypothetical protein F5Y16DRAFT_15897 [Xylariaceae sp. FL0255]|nr:hypothetical protein F5Y16DRAFT_15897 [Xylariaceae sp. FL0255]